MRDFFREYVWNNLGLKILALVSAVLMWLAVSRQPMVEIALTVPVEFHHVPDTLEISSESLPQAEVRLRGPEREVRAINPSEIHAVIDLSGAKVGERTYELIPSRIQVPRAVEVEQVVPAQFHLTFDVRASRTVPVRPRVIGALLTGYRLVRVSVDPANLTIIGPEKRVSAVEGAVTDPVDASGLLGTSIFTTHASVADPMVRIAYPGPIRVTVVTERVP